MLDIEKIRQLIEMMVENDLVEVSLRDGEEEVQLRRPTGPCEPIVQTGPAAAAVVTSAPASVLAEPEVDDGLVTISSPMVGTFYSSSDPDAAPFVAVGSPVSAGAVVCILEAMKVFNEIKSEVSGILEKVLVTNLEAVEFGQPLFAVKPG